jgi:hypothetical protein
MNNTLNRTIPLASKVREQLSFIEEKNKNDIAEAIFNKFSELVNYSAQEVYKIEIPACGLRLPTNDAVWQTLHKLYPEIKGSGYSVNVTRKVDTTIPDTSIYYAFFSV